MTANAPVEPRRIVKTTSELEMQPMERFGERVPGMRWHPIRYDDTTHSGFFVVEFEAGAASTAHEHPSNEEFYVLKGEFCDHDGFVYRAGEFVSLGAGTRHYSYSEHGATVLVWLTEPNRGVSTGESLSFGPDTIGRGRYSGCTEVGEQSEPSHVRLVRSLDALEFTPFDRYGDEVPQLFWNPITFDRETGQGCFVIRFAPGGVSTPHEHHGFEDFYIIEGEILDHDGVIYRQGDFVSLGPGVKHYSHSPQGVRVIAWLSDNNRPLSNEESLSFGPDVLCRARYRV